MTSDNKPSWDALRVQAADWLAGMDTGTADREAFEAWRNADPRHAVAFVQVANAARTLDRVKPDLKEMVPPVRPISRRAWLISGAALTAAVASGGLFEVATAKTTLTTNVGEQKVVRLPTGVVIDANTNSLVQWRISDGVLDVWLRKGEIALDLSETAQRCRLFIADQVAKFAGAKVNVRLVAGQLDLAVIKGHCTLDVKKHLATAVASDVSTNVTAGHAVLTVFDRTLVRALSAADMVALEAWPHGELVFEGETLGAVVLEYNRYLKRKIVIADESLVGIKLGGRFKLPDAADFLNALRKTFDIRVVDDGDGDIYLTK